MRARVRPRAAPAARRGAGENVRRRRRAGFGIPVLALLAGSLGILSGCDPVTLSEARTARIVVDAADGTQVQVVTSVNFVPIQEEEDWFVNAIEADTSWLEVPADRTFDLGAARRFYVELVQADPEDVEVFLTVFIDGKDQGPSSGVLTDGPIRFIFVGAL